MKNLSRWVFASIAYYFKTIADDLNLPYFVEGVDEREPDDMLQNHCEMRVTGPFTKEMSRGYYHIEININVLLTNLMEMTGENAYSIIDWCGAFQESMLDPIPVYKYGTGPQDTGQWIGCLRVKNNTQVNVFHFGQVNKTDRIRQSELDAVFEMDILENVVLQGLNKFTSASTFLPFAHAVELGAIIKESVSQNVALVSSSQGSVQFSSTWDTTKPGTSNSQQVTLPLVNSGNYDFTVYWGDGASDHITTWNSPSTTHTYNASGVYNVVIKGDIEGWQFNSGGDCQKMTNVDEWGVLQLGDVGGSHFRGCVNLTCNATDAPNLKGVTSLSRSFQGCHSFNGNINAWDVSDVVDFSWCFYGCVAFNQPLDKWNMSNAVDIRYMFRSCIEFNQDISSWDIRKVNSLAYTFFDCYKFNSPLNTWNTSNVTNITAAFYKCYKFNQPLNNWDVSKVGSFYYTFNECKEFNQNLNDWDTSSAYNMVGTFYRCDKFNQPLGNWDVSGVSNMSHVFGYCLLFDQDLGSWDIANVTDMTNMFLSGGLSTNNYDSLLVNWESQSVQPNVNFHAGSSKYSAGAPATARSNLVVSDGWTITDGGPA